jgi:hypothetical protein
MGARVKLGHTSKRTDKNGRVTMRATLRKGRVPVRLILGDRRTFAKAYIRAR